MDNRSNFRGMAAMVAATGAFVANDSCMKLVMVDAPPMQVLVMRGVAACLWCIPLVLALGYRREIAHAANPWVLLRCAGEIVAILAFVFALPHMQIADLTAIVQISPLLVLVGVSMIWSERIGMWRWLLIGVGITGALMVAQPGSSAASPFAGLGFVTAAGAAVRDIVSRKVPARIPGIVVALSTLVTVMLAAAAGTVAFETPVVPTFRHILLMLAAGFFLMCGHFLVFMAFRLAAARAVAPFNYSFTLWAVLSGLVIFGDIPNLPAIAGMVLITLSGLAIILLEGRERSSAQAVRG
jgi:drug/metabolite transporter (DMT)-like permease